ncbi:MAG: protoheme IX farnesyltransferase [Chloroflexi bacterium]|nr:MAG: protoheme IX farnesyltransferase [Chloroflexota bacterium]
MALRREALTRFTRLAALTVAMTFLLVVVGVVVRSTGSGLGCPEWPTCHGSWVPPVDNPHAIIEWSHRTTAAIVGLLALATAVAAMFGYRRRRSVLWPALAALGLVVFQAALGKAAVESDLSGEIVTAHLATAMALLALLIYLALRSSLPADSPRSPSGVGAVLALAAAAVFGLMLLGSHVTATGTALAFPDWPLMNGSAFPALTAADGPHVIHRWAAVVVGLVVGAAAFAAWRQRSGNPAVAGLALAAAALFIVEAVIGGLQVLTQLAVWTQVVHLSLAAGVWCLLVAATILSFYRHRREVGAASGVRAPLPTADSELAAAAIRDEPSRGQVLRAYVALTKPRIIELLLVTTIPTMVLAQKGIPSLWLMAAVVIGGTLAAGGANAINQFVDRDIDDLMRRTRNRPLPRHAVDPGAALRFGIGLSVLSFIWLTATVNLLSALLAASAIGFYVFVYTLWLKRSTPQNIVIGGAAGSVPVLVAWAAVTGTLGIPALVLFAIVFYWTPPHFWALALRYKGDYATARVPMMPVVRGEAETARQITLYSLLMVAVSLLLFPAAGMGPIYLAAALALGAAFVWYALRVQRHLADGRAAINLFRFSISYLTLLFVAIAADSLIRLSIG